MRKFSIWATTGAALLVTTTAVFAAPVYFNNRAAFQAAAGALLTESFETAVPQAPTLTFTHFQFSELNGIPAVGFYSDFPSLVPNVVTNGVNAILFDDNGDSLGAFTNFAGGGFFAFGVDVTVDVNTVVNIGGGGGVIASPPLNLVAGEPQFWGVINDSKIGSVIFEPAGGPNIGFDYLQYQLQGVPEPGTLALLGLGLAGLAATRRRKQ